MATVKSVPNFFVMKIHHPPHLYFDHTYYFLTARTYQGQKVFFCDERKQLLLISLKAEVQRYDYKLMAWVILENHYHLLFRTFKSDYLSKIINQVHGSVSYQLNKIDNTPGRKIFQNYWDRSMRDEKDFWSHFNYIHHNPVKHGYAISMENYKFSSYDYWLKRKGGKWLNSCFETYPILDFTTDNNQPEGWYP